MRKVRDAQDCEMDCITCSLRHQQTPKRTPSHLKVDFLGTTSQDHEQHLHLLYNSGLRHACQTDSRMGTTAYNPDTDTRIPPAPEIHRLSPSSSRIHLPMSSLIVPLLQVPHSRRVTIAAKLEKSQSQSRQGTVDG
jgi:hypothetical protein